MHVLHGFSQRRKSSRRPRDLHIRKVSFSGSSLSSGCSLSSSSSTISDVSTPTPTQTPIATTRPEIDPLASHPAFHAPPRLYERPFICMDEAEPVFYGGNDDEEQYVEHETAQPIEMALPPHVSPMDVADEQCKEPQDYFFTTLSKRPPMPRSRWSESTIQTLDQFDNSDSEDSDEITQSEESEDEDDDASVLEMRRLTRRASALKTISLNTTYAPRTGPAPKRPPMRSLDSVDNFIRRGGWKRRGIVFRQEDMENQQRSEADRASF
ncbi:hypothetical protein NCS57_00770200 [Fusarium keratoplasticum]|uniref:Uncharacterized protein n=1 Tax=Fusarium keratoplasticum TaxID=1328300 RepID=A0ACC0QX52_9HYPO|nr:hypothetical protein NCS57_00770200 [Fusarium keratoplasticum]KAI8669549.1 hypothetical protein NCS57_00770200 [Fusarium keratoplasticum]